ncbi:hypothetical protein EMCRGX_G024272 [Ephydatia muelleri]
MSGDVEESARVRPIGQDPLDSQCDEEHLLKISAAVTFNWKVIGRRLVGIKAVQDIDREDQCKQEKRDQMLEKWIELKGSEATYRGLIEVFEEVKDYHAADAVKELVSRDVVTALSPPKNVKIQEVTSTSAKIIWEPQDSNGGILMGYEVSYTPNGGHLNAVNVQNATTWKLTDLNPCTEYSISVKAKTAAVPITVSTLETVPSAPLDLRTQDVTCDVITVTWEPPQSPNGRLTGYEVSYTPKGGHPTVVDVQNITTWVLAGLKSSTTYTISVRARTVAGFGDDSVPLTVSTLESVLTFPLNVRTHDVTSTSINVIWEPLQSPNEKMIEYEICYTPSGGSQIVVDVQDSTAWKLTGLKPFTVYSISVRAKTAAAPVPILTSEDVPSPPLNVRTQDVASTTITVTWEPPQYPNGVLLGYEVCYTSNGDSPSAVNVQNASTVWKLTDMKPCTMYSISVRAKTVAGFGEKSIPVMISTLESAPSPPLNVRTQDVASTSITVTWEPPQYPNGVLLGYEVCYTSNGDSPSAVNVQNTSTAWKLTDMKPCTMYSISVRAKTVAGFGEKSTPVMISTGESAPSPPLNVRTQDVASTSITVTWEPPQYPNGVLLWYEVCYTSKGDSPSAVNVQNTSTAWKLTDMKPCTMYSISVRAKTVAGFGEKSTPVMISTLESAPSPPLNVRTQDVASTSITVTWEPPQYPNGVLLGYEVCYTSNGDSPSAVNVENTSTAWKLTDMKPWTMYSISVRAKTVAGFGEKSIPVMISTLESVPTPPLNVRIQDITSTSVTVTWEPPQNSNGRLLGYQIGYASSNGLVLDVLNVNTWNLTGLNPFTKYTIFVRAKTAAGFSNYSNPVMITTQLDLFSNNDTAKVNVSPYGDPPCGQTATGLTLYRGPLGGVYHITSGGNRAYHPELRGLY